MSRMFRFILFLYIFWQASVCWPLLCLCRQFCIFERCLDSHPESCRSQQASNQLSLQSPNLATYLPLSYPSPTQPPFSHLATHLPLGYPSPTQPPISHLATHLPLSYPSPTQPPFSHSATHLPLSHPSPTQLPISHLAAHLPLSHPSPTQLPISHLATLLPLSHPSPYATNKSLSEYNSAFSSTAC